MQSNAEFRQRISKLRHFFQRDARVIVKNESLNHFRQSFRDEGFTDEALDPWPDISERRKAQKRRKNGSLPKILTDTGDLGASLTGAVEGGDVVISSDLPYARRHNEGLAGMPKRQFMGPSKALTQTIKTKLDRGIGRLLNRF